jgi:hypothetical protein
MIADTVSLVRMDLLKLRRRRGLVAIVVLAPRGCGLSSPRSDALGVSL